MKIKPMMDLQNLYCGNNFYNRNFNNISLNTSVKIGNKNNDSWFNKRRFILREKNCNYS